MATSSKKERHRVATDERAHGLAVRIEFGDQSGAWDREQVRLMAAEAVRQVLGEAGPTWELTSWDGQASRATFLVPFGGIRAAKELWAALSVQSAFLGRALAVHLVVLTAMDEDDADGKSRTNEGRGEEE